VCLLEVEAVVFAEQVSIRVLWKGSVMVLTAAVTVVEVLSSSLKAAL